MTDLMATLADHILGPAHVGFIVPDLEKAVADACAVYGIAPERVHYHPERGTEGPTLFAFFNVAGLEFEYIEPREDHFRELLFTMPSGGGGINHVAWRVRDMDGALERLHSRGIVPGHVTPDGVVSFGGKKMVYLDPATTGGLVIELIELPESRMADKA
ncbi:MAG: VOC family protein [Halioglobus sp.]|nr:VOC family protein [Halioglobus sp.]